MPAVEGRDENKLLIRLIVSTLLLQRMPCVTAMLVAGLLPFLLLLVLLEQTPASIIKLPRLVCGLVGTPWEPGPRTATPHNILWQHMHLDLLFVLLGLQRIMWYGWKHYT
jgi:hypothetical protein